MLLYNRKATGKYHIFPFHNTVAPLVINCYLTCKQLCRLITGSFDRTVKIWSQDGQLRHRLETIFFNTITSLCYIPRAKVVWIASASQHATLFDPKAGENVSYRSNCNDAFKTS